MAKSKEDYDWKRFVRSRTFDMLKPVYDLGMVWSGDVQEQIRAHRLGSRDFYQLVGGIFRVLLYGACKPLG